MNYTLIHSISLPHASSTLNCATHQRMVDHHAMSHYIIAARVRAACHEIGYLASSKTPLTSSLVMIRISSRPRPSRTQPIGPFVSNAGASSRNLTQSHRRIPHYSGNAPGLALPCALDLVCLGTFKFARLELLAVVDVDDFDGEACACDCDCDCGDAGACLFQYRDLYAGKEE